jgi:type II secretory pathway component GspD/PulD (secretin)
VIIWADPGTNALVITAPAEAMRSLRMVIDKLDIRRAQVLVEAIVAEVAYNRAAELGVTWAVDGSADNNIVGLTKLGSGGNISDLAGAALGGGAAVGQVLRACHRDPARRRDASTANPAPTGAWCCAPCSPIPIPTCCPRPPS